MAGLNNSVIPSFSGQLEQYTIIRDEIQSALDRVMRSGWYILGREVSAFERAFADYCGVSYAVGCASGTEALALALMAVGVGSGDEVITVANTAVPTVSAISMVGATPVFVDIDEDFLMDVGRIESVISKKTKVIMPVHLYGQIADMDKITATAKEHNIPIIEDACQAHGAEYRGRRAGSWGSLGCFSFYPTKNLGCFGDGGAVTTNDKRLYELLTMLRNYGQEKRYYHSIKGINSRLDEVQAALLRVKLNYLDQWNEQRRRAAGWYCAALEDVCLCPNEKPDARHVYHLYVIRTKERDRLRVFLDEAGITTLMHYPVPVHLQQAYRDLGYKVGDLPVTETIAEEILSLPMHPAVTKEGIAYVAKQIREYFTKRNKST
ncbi:MAG: DegT/DnrJ/EryC1/StrS family aminotransferase [Candidatus Krumholzibacteria bacterium]|nr:DegT/DnrJ/EryC1/StrS family aminotransferase [Candidatus Krumholzibacteria bacterium]